MQQTTITFPDIQLSQRDGHKLRGYFNKLFGQDSDLWHNHQADGSPIYRYPLIQYKVIGKTPMLIGIEQGAPLLMQHFLDVKQLDIDDWTIPVVSKQINCSQMDVGVFDGMQQYQFLSPWYALSQKNYLRYKATEEEERPALLKRILIGNILSFLKNVNHNETRNIQVALSQLRPITANFKGQAMLMFKGAFSANVQLPNHIGLGRSVSRGYGCIIHFKG